MKLRRLASFASPMRRILAGALLLAAAVTPAAARPPIVVPTDHPTIQAAVDAAAAGDTVRVLAGTYAEQVVIRKDLRLVGEGEALTIVKPPPVMVRDAVRWFTLVTVGGGAAVRIQGLTVSGPGPRPCRSLHQGIHVGEGATLVLKHARVTAIRDTPLGPCAPAGAAVAVGLPPALGTDVGHATLEDVTIDDYQFVGFVVAGSGSTGSVKGSRIVGNGGLYYSIGAWGEYGGQIEIADNDVSQNQTGISVLSGASARVVENRVWGNRCLFGAPWCGPDPIEQYQSSGITLGSTAAGTEVRENEVWDSDVGIMTYFGPGAGREVRENDLHDVMFGIQVYDGTDVFTENRIRRAQVGVAVVAYTQDARAVLVENRIGETATPVAVHEVPPSVATIEER